jgi:hypothetical protein
VLVYCQDALGITTPASVVARADELIDGVRDFDPAVLYRLPAMVVGTQ